MLKHTVAFAIAASSLTIALDASAQKVPIVTSELPLATVNSTIDLLNTGDNAAVIRLAYLQHGANLNGWAMNAAIATEHQRDIVYCVALAVLRSEGTLSRERSPRRVVEEQARANLDWAIRAMEQLAMLGLVPDRHRAETWARDPGLKRAALELLRKMNAQGRLENEPQRQLLARLERELAGAEWT